jgi:hypothetical protein
MKLTLGGPLVLRDSSDGNEALSKGAPLQLRDGCRRFVEVAVLQEYQPRIRAGGSRNKEGYQIPIPYYDYYDY